LTGNVVARAENGGGLPPRVGLGESSGHDVLGHGVVAGEVLGHPGPHRGELLVADSAHQKRSSLLLLAAFDLVGSGIEIDLLESPAGAGVLPTPGRVDDAVEADELSDD